LNAPTKRSVLPALILKRPPCSARSETVHGTCKDEDIVTREERISSAVSALAQLMADEREEKSLMVNCATAAFVKIIKK
jgi:hypothetical protein